MKRNSKLAILIVLMTAAIFVWVPRSKKTKDVSSTTSSAAFDQAIPLARAEPRKRTEFVDWARDPFARPQRKEEVGSVSNLVLLCIIWNDKETQAFINESLVSVGDKITDKTVKQIDHDSVILTDGTKDYVLKLRE
jgi:hypothetical protein